MLQILQRCHAVLQEIPSGLRQKRPASIADSLHHMTACITFHMAKVRLYSCTDHFSWRIANVFHQQMNNSGLIRYAQHKILIFNSICHWKIQVIQKMNVIGLIDRCQQYLVNKFVFVLVCLASALFTAFLSYLHGFYLGPIVTLPPTLMLTFRKCTLVELCRSK